MKREGGQSRWEELRRAWAILTVYGRFEALIALLLRAVIGAVILVALFRLVVRVVNTLLLQSLNPLEHTTFQQVFGEVMTLLIALEFNHTLQYIPTRGRGIIQAKIVLLIALLALARKIIILDLTALPAESVAALAALAFSLGIAYWLVCERDDRVARTEPPNHV